MGDSSFLLLCFSVTVVVLVWARGRTFPAKNLPLPPGPRPLPLIGNLPDLPLEPSHLRKLNAEYGDVLYLNGFGTPLIVLGTHQAAIDLLEKRSTIYSDRNLADMADLTGFDWLFSMMRYGTRWRKVRSAFHHCMAPTAIAVYRPIQQDETKKYLGRLLDNPKHFFDHARLMIGAIILRATYGIDVNSADNKYIRIAEEAMDCFNVVFQPGKYLVQTFPWMRHIPSWLPGAKFQREFNAWRPTVRSIHDVPWDVAMAARRAGHSQTSVFSTLMERIRNDEDEAVAKSAAGSMYMAGADTSVSTLQTFLAAMASHPEVQKRAQEELDTFIGPDRLPTVEDKPGLPYVTALVKECFRWRSVVPLAVPHLSTEEDEYNGYRIPKGSIVVANTWAYSIDPSHYSNPEDFDPARFLVDGELNDKVLDPADYVFGYGRRICPGRHFAEASLFTIIASVLHTFSIEAPVDATGKPVPPSVEMTDGVVSYPAPFECTIKPRSTAAEALIRASCAEAT